MSDAGESNGVRADKWLWAARFFKTRSLAKKAIEGGKVHLNRQRIKVSRLVEPGMVLRIQIGWDDREIKVLGTSDNRLGAPEAQKLYQETPDSLKRRDEAAALRKAVRGQGVADHRPSSKERRQRDRLLRDLNHSLDE